MLKSQITDIESQSFIVRDQLVKFEFKLVPSDMKWLAKFSGELSNAANYPCSFANVLLSELRERGGSLVTGGIRSTEKGVAADCS